MIQDREKANIFLNNNFEKFKQMFLSKQNFWILNFDFHFFDSNLSEKSFVQKMSSLPR